MAATFARLSRVMDLPALTARLLTPRERQSSTCSSRRRAGESLPDSLAVRFLRPVPALSSDGQPLYRVRESEPGRATRSYSYCPAAGISKLPLYDLRHTAITRLCEKPNNAEEVIESIAGHITHQMKKRHSHVRLKARRAALAGLVPERLDRAYSVPGSTIDGNGPARTGKPLNNQHVLDMVEAGCLRRSW